MRLLSNKLLVERVKRAQATTGGSILLPPIALDDYNTGGPKEFRVLAKGPGRMVKGQLRPIECEPGDRIICQSYTTGPKEFGDGRMIITDDMILAVVPRIPLTDETSD